jgi:hypothetical protein
MVRGNFGREERYWLEDQIPRYLQLRDPGGGSYSEFYLTIRDEYIVRWPDISFLKGDTDSEKRNTLYNVRTDPFHTCYKITYLGYRESETGLSITPEGVQQGVLTVKLRKRN